MGVEWPETPAESDHHAAQLVREGKTLKCRHCGSPVLTFLDPPPAADGRAALAEALAEPLAAEESSGLDGLGVSPDWHPQ